MHSNSPFTEEGRTRLRNYQRRLNSYLGVWLVMGLMAGGALAYYQVKYGFKPLQSLYLKQYAKASIKSYLPLKKPSRYVLLVRSVIEPLTGKDVVKGCTDGDVEPMLDASGRQIYNRNVGPYFRLRPGVEANHFYWSPVVRPNKEMYLWMKEHIYGGRFLLLFFWPSFVAILGIFGCGTIYMIVMDTKKNREYEEGTLIRGSVLRSAAKFMKEQKGAKGIGIRVYGADLRGGEE